MGLFYGKKRLNQKREKIKTNPEQPIQVKPEVPPDKIEAASEKVSLLLEGLAEVTGTKKIDNLRILASAIIEASLRRGYDPLFMRNPEHRVIGALFLVVEALQYAILKGVSIEELIQLVRKNPDKS